MNSIGSLIFLSLAFGFTLAIRVVILIVLRSGDTKKDKRLLRPGEAQPTVIQSDLFTTQPKDTTQ